MMNRVELNEKELMNVAGGNSLRDIPEYNLIKEFYITKGINSAISLCLYYYNSADSYEIIRMIGEELDGDKSETSAF